MSYNKDIDYQSKIDESVKNGDYKSAAEYEKSRNEKIDGENLGYEKTNRYSGHLDTTDYGTIIKDQISKGASKDAVSQTLKKRVSKASGTEGLSQFAYDDIYDKAVKYIMGMDNYSYEKRNASYTDRYSDDSDKILKSLINRKAFSYNPYNDDLYKYYKNEYRREGERAMEDLIGKLSANTGGIASSYAAGAASQAYNYYNSKTADKIPELYSMHYDEYLDSLNLDGDIFDDILKMRENDYLKYRDSVKDYESDRDFDYKKYTDGLDEEYRRKSFEHDELESERDYSAALKKLALDAEEAETKKQENADKMQRQEKQDSIESALKKWDSLGYLDPVSAQILGLPAGLHTVDYDYKQAQKYKIYNK